MPLISLIPQKESPAENTTHPELLVLGVWISDSSITALLLRLQAGAVTLVRSSRTTPYQGVEGAVSVADGALQELGKESETVNDVIYILEHSWIKNGDITLEKKPYVKAITTELDLSPIGFVEPTEALTNYAVQQNARYSGIFVLLGEQTITVTLVEHASITETQVVGRSGSTANDVLEGLARFAQASDEKASYLPPQLSITSLYEEDTALTKVQQELLSMPLTESVKFLQAPTISVVPKEKYLQQVVTEAGTAIADAKGLVQARSKSDIPLSEQIIRVPDETANVRPVSAAELGFSEVESPTQVKQQALSQEKDTDVSESESPTSFGIPISASALEKDVAKTSDPAAQIHREEAYSQGDFSVSQKKNTGFSGFASKHHKNTKLFVGLGVALGVLVLLVLSGWLVLFRSTASVAVVLATKPITQEAEISVSADLAATDVENLILSADTVRTTVSGDNTILTTGVKVVGEEAKGTVIIYNKTTADKELESGTVLSAGDRSYSLDETVTLPAATVTEKSTGEEKEYGSVETTVTATQIGAEGNIEKDTNMSVGSFATNTYEARVKNAFEGGSSREVQVVSAGDQAEAVADLQAQLEEEALAALQDSAGSGEYVLPQVNVVSKTVTFSSEIDAEANEVTAYVELEVEALRYTAESLEPIAEKVLASEVPEGYTLSDATPSILSRPAENTDASASAKRIIANISSEAVPILDVEGLWQYVLGKNTEDAERNLEDHQGISEASIVITPGLISKVPSSKDRVTITIVDSE